MKDKENREENGKREGREKYKKNKIYGTF